MTKKHSYAAPEAEILELRVGDQLLTGSPWDVLYNTETMEIDEEIFTF